MQRTIAWTQIKFKPSGLTRSAHMILIFNRADNFNLELVHIILIISIEILFQEETSM